MTAALSVEESSRLIAIWVPLDALEPNPEQPRKVFDQEKLEELTESIRAKGRIIEPLVARPLGGERYEIVCGERRWRAAKAAGLTEAPVVVRDLSDQEAFEESLTENIDREDMVAIDEVRAVSRLASDNGVQQAARRLGKPHHWVSKRKRIAEAPAFILEFLESGASADIEALYELAKLADTDAAAAQSIVENHAQSGHLRDQVKTAARQAREGDDEEHPDGSHANYSSPANEEPRLSHAGGARSSDDDDDADDPDAEGPNDVAAAKPSWLPSDAPELDDPFDADPPLLVLAVAARRAGHIVLTTSAGSTAYEFTEEARAQLRALLFPEAEADALLAR